MKLRKRAMRFGAILALVAGFVGTDPAAAEKPPPAQAGQDDPRSGAALNREQLKHPGPSPDPIYPDDPGAFIRGPGVNNAAADTTARDTQSETSVAVVGNNPVVAWNDSGSSLSGNGRHFTGNGNSLDGGNTFTDRGTPPDSAEGDAGDPVLAVHQATGAVYYSTLGFQTGENLQVFKSTNTGTTFGAPVNGTPGFAGTGDFQDKEWMAVDNAAGTGNGNVYLCWTRFTAAGGAEIRVTRSTNAGASFGPNQGLLLSNGGQGCFTVVGPDHSVYVFFYRGTGSGGQGGDNKLFVRKSTDRGVTYGAEVQVADLVTSTTNGNLGLNGGLRSNSFPHAAVNPVTGAIYAVYNDNPADADGADTYLVRSTTGGATWQAPVQLNDDDGARDQFFPTVSVAPAGTSLMVGYYSRSFDPLNSLIHRRGRLALVNTSTNALTFKPSFQMGSNFPVVIGQDPVINPTYMGDYDQIAAATNDFHSVWSDNVDANSFHANQPDVRYARIARTPSAVALSVTLADSPDPVAYGGTLTYTATVTNSGPNRADDVYLNDAFPTGLTPRTATGGRCNIQGRFASCYLDSINSGASKTVTITAFVAQTSSVSNAVSISTADDDVSGNNFASASTQVNGSGETDTYSTGNIATPIPDSGQVDIPINVPLSRNATNVDVLVRLNHTFDSDLDLFLISPGGKVVELSSNNGGSGDNYGSGTNSCSGSFTRFSANGATSITAGTAPFVGTFRPESPLTNYVGDPIQGTWRLRVVDEAGQDVGTVGCVQLAITHPK